MRACGSVRQRGSVVLWLLGLATLLLPLGGLGLDLSRAFSERRALAAAADSAALAGAGALDEARYRRDGTVVLDPEAAAALARDSLAAQLDRSALDTVDVRADERSVTVTVEGAVDLSLLRLFRGEPFRVRVSSHASPHLRP